MDDGASAVSAGAAPKDELEKNKTRVKVRRVKRRDSVLLGAFMTYTSNSIGRMTMTEKFDIFLRIPPPPHCQEVFGSGVVVQ
ncbi:hypothetical protein [Fretibacterium sp. OH1220_COT-178]|uniref:hypothetical protein n=1 Tax=Fretibacterium sp. OH1220_COT-178 TaxID=2491047 RepID=UPI001315A629|nr:hypothetical protein [Fretibacterium sp. OH1220_COT-178]